MNSLQIPDCATPSRMEGEPIATRKEWRERRAPFFVERRARRSYQQETILSQTRAVAKTGRLKLFKEKNEECVCVIMILLVELNYWIKLID